MSDPNGTTTIRGLIQYFLPYVLAIKRQALWSCALVIAAPFIAAALLWSFKILIDEVLVAGRTDLLTTFAFVYAATAAAKIAVEYASRWIEANAVESIVLALRSDLYAHVMSLSPGSLGKTTSGDILTRLQGDTNRTEYLIYTGPLAALADGATAIVFIGFLFFLNWQLTLCTLAVLPVIIWLVHKFAPLVRKASKLSRRADALWMSLAEERLDAIPVVHAFDAEASETRSFRRRAGKVRRMEVTSNVLQARQSALVEAAVALGGLGVLWFGTTLIGSGVMTVGALIAFIGTVSSLYAPVRSLAKSAGRFHSAAAGAQRVAGLMDQASLVRDRPGARLLGMVRGAIEFRDVEFTYPNGQKALHGISLVIGPGETVALVGPSGSGKSSLARLLLRQYEVDAGAVLIDGADVRNVKLAALRQAIAPVFQDALVLNGTIESNIRYGTPAATVVQVEAAARAAAVDRFAAAKDGLLTPVGAWGSRLSGGQRQRIALARALLRDAPILLLDEATSGVDSETEELIQDAIDVLAGKRTIIVVAHRLSSVRNADRVVVIEDGRIVETGTPAELLSRNSRCRELFAAQLTHKEAAE